MPPDIRVTLPDGSERGVPAGSTGADLAKAIGPGLAKAALAVRVNGNVWDLARPLPDGAKVTILTDKDPQALEVLRHSSAHVLATAVRQLFPQAKIGFGRSRTRPRSGDRIRSSAAVPPGEDRIRSPDRGRVLLRLRGGTALRAGGPGSDRKQDGGGGQSGLPVRSRGGGSRGSQASLQG